MTYEIQVLAWNRHKNVAGLFIEPIPLKPRGFTVQRENGICMHPLLRISGRNNLKKKHI